jgi:hypothetical protein
VRIGVFVAATLLVLGAASGARAQQTDFAGKWSFSGQIVSGRMFYSFAQICDLNRRTANSPDRAMDRTAAARWWAWSMRWIDLPHEFTNSPNLSGVSTFHGALGADDIVRGSVTNSRAPGARGVAAMMRI